ncbi:hypothetical protein ERO13_A12G142600v2 [Gossypium hirsutum]|nr:hypothetical protein ERO13_A12G142600v2 [Gossypium hirsutum]
MREFFLFFFFCSLPLPFKTPLHIQPIRPLGTAVERNPGDRETPGTWRWRARGSGVQDSLLIVRRLKADGGKGFLCCNVLSGLRFSLGLVNGFG